MHVSDGLHGKGEQGSMSTGKTLPCLGIGQRLLLIIVIVHVMHQEDS